MPLTREDLVNLGLPGAAVTAELELGPTIRVGQGLVDSMRGVIGPAQDLVDPTGSLDPARRGRSGDAAPNLARFARDMRRFVEPPLASFGVTIEIALTRPSVFRLNLAEHPGARVHPRPGEATLERDPVDPNLWYADIGTSGSIVAVTDWFALVVTPGAAPEKLHLAFYEVAPLAREPRALPAEEVRAWLADLEDDFLQRVVPPLLERGGPWGVAVAVGHCARLWEPSPERWAGLRERLLRGLRPDEIDRCRAWCLALDDEQVEGVAHAALAAVHLLEERLLPRRAADPADGAREPLLRLCHERDRIESACWVLAAARGPARVERARDRIDGIGRPLVAAAGANEIATLRSDEHLARVALRDPGAWWAGVPEPGGLEPDDDPDAVSGGNGPR